jgi:hypothetical protein
MEQRKRSPARLSAIRTKAEKIMEDVGRTVDMGPAEIRLTKQ